VVTPLQPPEVASIARKMLDLVSVPVAVWYDALAAETSPSRLQMKPFRRSERPNLPQFAMSAVTATWIAGCTTC
jgi:hypothetical protein